jgi:hypothetical protein
MRDAVGLLFALTLPGLVSLLVLLAAVERFGQWFGRSVLPGRRAAPPGMSASGMDELTACFYAGKRAELDQRCTESMLRDEVRSGGVDLERGVVSLRRQPADRPRSVAAVAKAR